jgi:hypothetical protein
MVQENQSRNDPEGGNQPRERTGYGNTTKRNREDYLEVRETLGKRKQFDFFVEFTNN